MSIPVDITNLPKWHAYGEAPSWPGAPDALFIVAAAARVLSAKFGMLPDDIASDPDSEGYRNEIASSLAALLTNGSLLATARRVDGSRQEPIPPTEWTPLSAHQAVATGLVRRDHGRKRDVLHWVFLGKRETDILTTLYQATDMLYPAKEAGPTEAMGETVLAAVSALARNPAAIAADNHSSATVRLLQPHLVPTLHPDDREAMITASVPWLIDRFRDVHSAGWDYYDFEKVAVEQLAPVMTGRLFEKVWAEGRAKLRWAARHLRDLDRAKVLRGGEERVETEEETRTRWEAEALVPHAHRFRSGPNPGAAKAL